MISLASRPLRALLVATTIAVASGVATTPASAGAKAHGAKKAAQAKKRGPVKKAKKRAQGRADLVARGLRVDVLDGSFVVEAKVANVGTKIARPSDVTLALSSDPVLDGSDDVIDELEVGSLQIGVERTVGTETEISDEFPSGDVYLLVCADGNGAVRESNETNNCVSQLVSSDEPGEDDGEDDGEDAGDDAGNQAAIDDADDGIELT